MIVTEIVASPPYPERFRSQADELYLPRSRGLHLTPIIRDLEQVARPRDEWCSEEDLSFFAAGGFLWERVFSEAHRDAVLAGNLIRPGEFTLDGITGSPDLIRVSDWTLIETKACWKSARKFDHLEKWFWSWIVQVSCYCKMVNTTVAEIHAFFVAGDWRPPVPCVRSVRLEFTEQEIEERWHMVVSHARRKGLVS